MPEHAAQLLRQEEVTRLNGSARLAFLVPGEKTGFTIKKAKTETESKVDVPISWFDSDETAERFMVNLTGSDAILGPEITSAHKIRAILDTDNLDIMNGLSGALTLTYSPEGQTSQRYKTRPANLGNFSTDDDYEEEGLEANSESALVRKERKSEIDGFVARPVLQAIKSDKLRAQLEQIEDDIRVQGIMDYSTHKAKIVIDGVNVSVSLDRVTIHPRFADMEPVTFSELEFDTLQKGEKAKRVIDDLAQKVAGSIDDPNVRIITTPKEERLLGNEEFLTRLAADTAAFAKLKKGKKTEVREQRLAEDETFITSFLQRNRNGDAPNSQSKFDDVRPS